jgi:diguanylate cyclase
MSQVIESNKYTTVIGDYSAWFAQVVRESFYRDSKMNQEKVLFPEPLFALLGIDEGDVSPAIAQMQRIQDDLHKSAEAILEGTRLPDIYDFDNFLQSYEGFMGRLQRLEIDSLLFDFGMDRTTGLRSASVMIADLERELDRRARRGQPFSVVVARLDTWSEENYEERVKLASAAIRDCMRSFDDAYVSGEGEFIVSLKHADASGGIRFVDRLQEFLQKSRTDFSMSFCVAEPLPGDNITDLVENVRGDLQQTIVRGGGVTKQYEDLSPLQRFLSTITK